MKLHVAVLLMVIGLTLAEHIHDNGQPGCKSQEEIDIRNFRNNWDPTVYWVCTQIGEPAKIAKCPHGTAWLDSQKKCIEWRDWEWEEPKEPPSRP